MKIAVDQNLFVQRFRDYGRSDNFSYAGLCALFDYLEELDENLELDVVAICFDYSEQGFEDIANDYDIDLNECEDDQEKFDTVLEYLNDHTSVIYSDGEDLILYANF